MKGLRLIGILLFVSGCLADSDSDSSRDPDLGIPELNFKATEIGNVDVPTKVIYFRPDRATQNPFVGASTLALISNPFESEANSIAELFPDLPKGSAIVRMVNGAPKVITSNRDSSGFMNWSDPGERLSFREGVWVRLSNAEISGDQFSFSIRGTTAAGVYSTALPPADELGLISSSIPRSGYLTTDLGYPVSLGDYIYTFDPKTGYKIFGFHPNEHGVIGWYPSEPFIQAGESFWVRRMVSVPTHWFQTSLQTSPSIVQWTIPLNRGEYDYSNLAPGPRYGQRLTTVRTASVYSTIYNGLQKTGEQLEGTKAVLLLTTPRLVDGARWWVVQFDLTSEQSHLWGLTRGYVREEDMGIFTDRTPPNPPADVRASVYCNTTLLLRWTNQDFTDTPATIGNLIYRKSVNGDFTLIGERATTADKIFYDHGVAPSVPHTYKIRAKDISGNLSDYSAEVSGSVNPVPPVKFGIGDSVRPTISSPFRTPIDTRSLTGSYFISGPRNWECSGEIWWPIATTRGGPTLGTIREEHLVLLTTSYH